MPYYKSLMPQDDLDECVRIVFGRLNVGLLHALASVDIKIAIEDF